tara:strand:- start:2020 stop:4407 length:2388 start_codon:yes stop_codon:yes gene_type:complete
MEKCIINNNEFDFILSNDSQNVISISEKIESFSDVYECTLNDKQIILEKVGDVDGNPLVYIDIEYKGKKYVTEAILVNDKESYIKINESNLHLIKTDESLIIDNTNKEDKKVLIEKIEQGSIKNEATDVMGFLGQTLQKYSDDRLKIKLDKYNEIYNEKIDLLELKKNQTLKHLEEEFNKNLRILKDDIQDRLQLFLRETDKENKDSITLQSKELSNKINEKYDSFIAEIKDIKEFTSKNINKFLDVKYKEVTKLVESYIDNISKEFKLLEKKKENSNKSINEANKELTKIKNSIALIEKEDNKKINKQNNIIQSLLKDTNKKFNHLNEKFKLLSESKNNEYNELLAAVNNKEVVEYKTILKEKIQDVELTQVKDELIKEVTENFSQDMRGLKRYVEMSSGGGTNAVQYANGGTMNGDLTVTGTMEADTILANTLLSSTNLDIGFELSGFNVTGDISANGDVQGSTLLTDQYLKHNGDTDTNIEFLDNKIRVNSNLNTIMEFNGTTSRVGIGVVDPAEVLDVSGNVQGLGGRFTGNSQAFGGLTVGGSSQFNVDHTGNLLTSGNLTATNITVTDDLSAGDIIKGTRLNIGGGKLFVDDGTSTGNAFVKIGAYGSGNFFGKEGSVNGATFSLGVGSAGKIVEDMRVETFAISGAGLVNKNTNPVILVASPGANKYIVPVSIQVYKSQSGGTRVSWGSGIAAIGIGTFASSDTTGTFSQLTSLPRSVADLNGDWLYNRNQGPDTTTRIHSNRALAFRTSSDISGNGSADVYYLKVRYMVMSEDGDFKSIANLQRKDT